MDGCSMHDISHGAFPLSDVLLKVPPPGESGRAPGAAKRFGTCVFGGPVVLEVVPAMEGLLTEVTLVGFLPGVVPHMAVSVGPGREVLPAVFTQIALVVGHGVGFKVVEVLEDLFAQLAGVDLVGVGDSFEDCGGVSIG